MQNEQEKKQQDQHTTQNKDTDVTRTQNREAVADAAEHPAPDTPAKQTVQAQPDNETGSHREGNYERNEQSQQPDIQRKDNVV